MPTTITPIPPFYDERSNAPPPCTPILTDQQELWGKVTRSSGLLADEMLTPSHLETLRPSPGFKLSPAKLPKTTVRVLSPAPYTKKPLKRDCASSKAINSSSDDEGSIESSDDESTLSTSSEDSKIPKPSGEPGRPGRGGYNLEIALGWNQKLFVKFKKYIHALIDEHLDVSKCASAQSTVLLKIIQDKATNKFPDLENYARCWPVTDLIMMRLKYTSGRARRQELEMAAGKSKKWSV
ncbi:hypothetical protein BU15DRAFT_80559 [Melanogaster broomeanus]|nr:hypothetical protein BU15DRAFT_80559 [Melanogaster broomeanus]